MNVLLTKFLGRFDHVEQFWFETFDMLCSVADSKLVFELILLFPLCLAGVGGPGRE